MPSVSLPALERHLEASLLELDKLRRTRPGLPTALARAEAGQRIDTTPAESLEDAAVKLRRLGAYVDEGQPARLLAGALGAVEAGQLPTRPADQ